MKIKKGDKVQILTGKDRGKSGKILAINIEQQRVTIEGLNLRFKNMRARKQGEKGQRLQFPAPMHISNIAVLDPKSGKPTRVGFTYTEDKKKIRIARKSKEPIS